MAYVNVAEWKPDQVTDWLKGLDSIIVPYCHSFLNNQVNGQQLLNLGPDDLDHLGVYKLGHQEIILEAVELLRNFSGHVPIGPRQRVMLIPLEMAKYKKREEVPLVPWPLTETPDVQQPLSVCRLPLLSWLRLEDLSMIVDKNKMQKRTMRHYELDRETLQLLALRLTCMARSLHNELTRNHRDADRVTTQTLADVATIVQAVQPLACWLDRSPFSGQLEYMSRRGELLSLSLEMATCAQRDRFAERPVQELRQSSLKMANLADSIIQDIRDPLLLQPASLELVTLKKRSSDDLGFYIVPSFYGVHQIQHLKLNSAAHQCGKLEPGDEIVQINYQTVVGWQVKQVMALFEESPTEVLLTVKKRPRHTKVYGQIYMKPYRLPSKKRIMQNSFARWADNIPSPRPEFLTIPHFDMPSAKPALVEQVVINTELPSSSDEEEEEEVGLEGEGASSPTSARIYLPKPRLPVQRRATVTGASPVSKRAPVNLQQFWEELKRERQWRGFGVEKTKASPSSQNFEMSRKFSSDGSLKRNTICIGSSKPDIITSCEMRLKSMGGSDDTFKTAEMSERQSSSDITSLGCANTRTISVGSDDGRVGDLFEKSIESDDVFKRAGGNFARPSKELPELKENLHEGSDSVGLEHIAHTRNKSIENDSVFGVDSDNKSDIIKDVGSFKEIKEMFSKIVSENVKQTVKREKPEVPVRTSKPSPDKPIPNKTTPPVPPVRASLQNKMKQSSQHQTSEKREKGKLVSSFSTPAYDCSDSSTSERLCPLNPNLIAVDAKTESKSDSAFEDSKSDLESSSGLEEDTKTYDNSISASIPSITEELVEFEREVHGQIVNTINSLTKDHELDIQPKWEDKNPPLVVGPDLLIESSEKKMNEILNTICSSLPDHSERDLKLRKTSPEGADLSKTISRVVKEDWYSPSSSYKPGSLENLSEPKLKRSIPVKPRTRVIPPAIIEEKLPDLTFSPPPPEMPRRKPVSNLDLMESAPATFPRQKTESRRTISPPSRRPLTPPEPPPRPSPPAVPAPRSSSASSRLALIRTSISKTTKVASSPRSSRKKNSLSAKKRNVSVKELGACECEGWLQQRSKRGAQWSRGWVIIKGTNFYKFQHKDAVKADLMIHLPGFTVSRAEEVNSRPHAFKVYHTGTMFYFAASNHEEMTNWMDCITIATRSQDSHFTTPQFSESEGEGDGSGEEGSSGWCVPSPKSKLSFLGSSSKPSPSSSNSSTLEKSSKFSSLKKQKRQNEGGSSLDRKSLGGGLWAKPALPVPTSHTRIFVRQNPKLLHQSAESVLTLDTNVSSFGGETPQRSPRMPPAPGLPSPPPQPLPPDMADYRLASLAKTRRREAQEQDTSGFVTLEALMLSRQEEERRAQSANPPPPTTTIRVRTVDMSEAPRVTPRVLAPPCPAPITQPRPAHSRSTSAFTDEREREREISSGATVMRRSSFNTPSRLRQLEENHDYRDGSPEKLWIDSLRRPARRYPPTPRHTPSHQVQPLPPRNGRLKKAALYQPPPVSPLDTPGGSEGMQLAFEMTLDQSSQDAKRRYAKVTPTPASRLMNLFTGRSDHNPSEKTLLGSPRLHRALFRGSVIRSDSNGETVNSPPLSPPQEPMEVQMANPTTPDYPGLEYPPVFEPGTYSLADASSVLRQRNREAR